MTTNGTALYTVGPFVLSHASSHTQAVVASQAHGVARRANIAPALWSTRALAPRVGAQRALEHHLLRRLSRTAWSWPTVGAVPTRGFGRPGARAQGARRCPPHDSGEPPDRRSSCRAPRSHSVRPGRPNGARLRSRPTRGSRLARSEGAGRTPVPHDSESRRTEGPRAEHRRGAVPPPRVGTAYGRLARRERRETALARTKARGSQSCGTRCGRAARSGGRAGRAGWMVRGDAHRVGPLTGRRARPIVAGARRRPGTSPQRVPKLLSATSVVVAFRRSAAEPSRDSSPRPEKRLRSAPGTEQHELDPPVPGATGGAAAPPRGVRVRPRAPPNWLK